MTVNGPLLDHTFEGEYKMKKIGMGVLIALVLVTGLAGAAFAQTDTPPTAPTPHVDRMEALAGKLGMTLEELQAALNSGQTVQELADAAGVELPQRVARGGRLAELLGMTPEELKAALDSGQTVQELADAAGVELPRRVARGGRIAELLGMTSEELQTALDSGQTIQELADAAGVELPQRPEGRDFRDGRTD